MADCNHVLGYSKSTVTNRETGEVIVSWLEEVRESNATAVHWTGSHFAFCPECGAALPDRKGLKNVWIEGSAGRRSGDSQ